MCSLESCIEVCSPRCVATREINTKITLLWAHIQSATRIHTLLSLSLSLSDYLYKAHAEISEVTWNASLWNLPAVYKKLLPEIQIFNGYTPFIPYKPYMSNMSEIVYFAWDHSKCIRKHVDVSKTVYTYNKFFTWISSIKYPMKCLNRNVYFCCIAYQYV